MNEEQALTAEARDYVWKNMRVYTSSTAAEYTRHLASFALTRKAEWERKAVRRAFDVLLDKFVGCDVHGYEDIADQMDAVLAEMEAKV